MNLVIRPPRAQYEPARALPGPALRVDNKNFVRTDLQARFEGPRLSTVARLVSDRHAPELNRAPLPSPSCSSSAQRATSSSARTTRPKFGLPRSERSPAGPDRAACLQTYHADEVVIHLPGKPVGAPRRRPPELQRRV